MLHQRMVSNEIAVRFWSTSNRFEFKTIWQGASVNSKKYYYSIIATNFKWTHPFQETKRRESVNYI